MTAALDRLLYGCHKKRRHEAKMRYSREGIPRPCYPHSRDGLLTFSRNAYGCRHPDQVPTKYRPEARDTVVNHGMVVWQTVLEHRLSQSRWSYALRYSTSYNKSIRTPAVPASLEWTTDLPTAGQVSDLARRCSLHLFSAPGSTPSRPAGESAPNTEGFPLMPAHNTTPASNSGKGVPLCTRGGLDSW